MTNETSDSRRKRKHRAYDRINKSWAYGIAAVAAGCLLILGNDLLDREGRIQQTRTELEQVKEPLAQECVSNGFVFNALRQVCTEIVDGETPSAPPVPVLPPEVPAERFPLAPATPVPSVVTIPPAPGSLEPPSTVTLTPGPPPPPVVVTSVQPPPPRETVTVTQPPPPPVTETVTVTAEPPPPTTDEIGE